MNEVIKLYENANVKKDWCATPYGGIVEYYQPFTPEKQLELIKWLSKKGVYISSIAHEYSFVLCEYITDFGSKIFEEALSGVINDLWQDLTKEERKQIKEILE